jgi:putative ABC transport system ATP-binding protein
MIELRDVTLTYPDGDGIVTAINSASLTVQPGAITAITGPSGSGKSSLLAVAFTLITPQSGSVLINGAVASGLSRSETAALRRETIGIVFQQPNLLASLTALEQLELMSYLGSTSATRSRSETRTKPPSCSQAWLARRTSARTRCPVANASGSTSPAPS